MTTENQMVAEYITIDILATQLSEIKSQQFSGRILLKSSLGQEWFLYVYFGRILYATGGNHPIRRWIRNSTIAGVDVSVAKDIQVRIDALTDVSALTRTELNTCWEYYLLVNWAHQGRINRNALIEQIQTTIVEVLFDIIQAGKVSCEQIVEEQLSPQLTLLDIDRLFDLALQQQQQWEKGGLTGILPDQAIKIIKIAELQQMVSTSTYQALKFALDGEQSIREIATTARQLPLMIGQSFLSHIKAKRLQLVELPDFVSPLGRIDAADTAPLVICIDDSPSVCDLLEQIFRSAGYRFISILDSRKAISIVMANQPQLIFLDLVMPNSSGYEICSLLRKTNKFQNTPIVILTSNDSTIDRVRAKVAGANDFLTKPVQSELVLNIAQKYLKFK